MRKLLIIFIFLATTFNLKAQVLKERKHIQGGSQMWTNFTKEMFMYPEFIEGVVYYKNGQQFKRLLNYNRMLKTIQFIDEKGDTLAIDNEAAVKTITVKDDEFIYFPNCLQAIAKNERLGLYKHEELRIADIRRKGLYGAPNSSGSYESINQVYTWMNSYQLDINELLLLSKTTTFYIVTAHDELLTANRKNVLAQFTDNKTKISDFIKAKKISFTNETDLEQLSDYIRSL
jgi:hypothetical protein